jgi:hypothetical protein
MSQMGKAIDGGFMDKYKRRGACMKDGDIHVTSDMFEFGRKKDGENSAKAVVDHVSNIDAKILAGFGVGAEIRLKGKSAVFVIFELNKRGDLVLTKKGDESGKKFSPRLSILSTEWELVKASSVIRDEKKP